MKKTLKDFARAVEVVHSELLFEGRDEDWEVKENDYDAMMAISYLEMARCCLMKEHQKRLAAPLKPGSVRFLNTLETCEHLRIGRATLDRLVRDGMPVSWVGRKRTFFMPDCRAWLELRGKRGASARST